jgi:chromosome segregation ATPase
MSKLMEELENTIQNLEGIRDSQDAPPDELLKQLDALYEQKIMLITAAINENTQQYAAALDAMTQAAKTTKTAIADLAKLEESIGKVATAIAKVSEVLLKIA